MSIPGVRAWLHGWAHTWAHTAAHWPRSAPWPNAGSEPDQALGLRGLFTLLEQVWVGAEGPVLGSVSKDAILFTVTDSGPITVPGTK